MPWDGPWLHPQEMHFVMEYMSGGELYKRLSSRKRYSEVGSGSALRWEIFPHGKHAIFEWENQGKCMFNIVSSGEVYIWKIDF